MEMLTGRPVFAGETISHILAAVLKSDPDWMTLPADTPVPIRRLLRRCLVKDRRERLDSASVARLEIDEAGLEPDAVAATANVKAGRLAWVLVAVLLLASLALAFPAMQRFRETPPVTAPEMRLEITTPPTTDPASFAISPDGRKLVFVATSEGRPQLWLRSIDNASARPLAGTDGAAAPFWSPDSRSLAFTSGALKRIDLDGGSVQVLSAGVTYGTGGAWSRDGTILFTPIGPSPLFRISANGGQPVAATRLTSPQVGHLCPQFLPDGRHFLYSVAGSPEVRGVYVGQLDGPSTARVLDTDPGALYAAGSRHLLFVRQGTLLAQRFDPVRLALSGSPFPVGEHMAAAPICAAFSVSLAGPIVYRTELVREQRQFVWLDRSGKELARVGDPDNALASNPSLSPDGRRVALNRASLFNVSNTGVWLLDVTRGVLTRFTADAGLDFFPLWSPDGTSVVFMSSNANGAGDLYRKSLTGTGDPELLLATPESKLPSDWSPDGQFVLYRSLGLGVGTSHDLWALPMTGDRKPFPVVQTPFNERDGQFSPDGKWIAYQSDESGRFEIYVQPFPGPGRKERLSTNGGAQVRWRHDGRELFYIALDGRLMAVPIQLASNGQSVQAGAPVPLFATHVGGALQGVNRQQYAVSPDGQRFLMNTITEDATGPITVILNWKAKP
jgi:Tol biopolymer transport system component